MIELAKNIREQLETIRKDRKRSFVEETHTYGILDPTTNQIVSNLPSVTTLIKQFSEPFDSIGNSMRMTGDDEAEAKKLRDMWKEMGKKAGDVGSFAHYKLEQYVWSLFDIEKETRKPDFNLNHQEMFEAQKMVRNGVRLIHQIVENGFVPLETECIMGSIDLGYVGQCDNIWIGNYKNQATLLMSDYKTNKTKNFEIAHYNKPMKDPFVDLYDTQLSKYFVQQALYAQLFKDMLKDTEYKDLDFIGFKVLHLRDNGNSIKIPNSVYEKVKQLYPIK